MKRILVYGLTDTKGGVENFLLNYISKFDRDLIQVDLISNTSNTAYESEFSELGCHVYKVCSKRKNPLQFKKDMRKIFENPNLKYDLIWVNLCSLANIDYLKYAKKYGITVRIVHCHNGSNMFGKLKGYLHNINRYRIRKIATHYWTCSTQAAEWFYPKTLLSNKNFSIINNAISTNKFHFNESIREDYRKKLGLEDKFIIGNIGRLHFQKNQNFLIEIMKELSIVSKDIHLLIVGEGELKKDLQKKVKELNLEANISFLGVRDDIPQILQAIDLFVMPSLFEGLPVSAVEAQATGVYCIMSNNITQEIKLTNLVDFVDIEGSDAVNKWAEMILKVRKGYKRTDMKKEIINNNYEIMIEAKRLQSLLCEEIRLNSGEL